MINLNQINITHKPECYEGTNCQTGVMIATGGIEVESMCSYDERYSLQGIRWMVENNIKRKIWHEIYGEIENKLMRLVWDSYKSCADMHTPNHVLIEKIRDGISEIFNETKPDLN